MLITGVRTLTQALAAPALTSSVAGTTATLNWTAPTPTGQSAIAGYRVYKSATLGGTYTQLGGSLPPGQTSFTDTLSATSFYKVEAFDQFVTGGRSGSVQCAPVVSGAIKLPLGNGMWTDNQFWTGSTGLPAQEQSNFNNYFPTWSANPYVKWFYMSLTWGAIEGPTRGDYTKGFAAIDYVLNKLATAGHKMGVIVEIWQTFFNTTNITDLASWPQYVVNNGWIQSCFEAGANRTQLKWDIDDLWTAYNNMLVALCDRYNSHPLFYGIASGDESEAISIVDNVAQPANSGLSPHQTIINSVHYQTKYLEQQLLMLSHLPNTLCYVPFNYLPPGDSTIPSVMANMINTIEAQYPKHAIYGGPDPFVRQTTFQKLVAGLLPTSGMGDVRSNLLLMNRVQEGYLGNSGSPPANPGVTPGQLYDTALANNCVMLTWNHQTWEFYKYADQIAAIQARNGAVGTPPAGGNYQLV
jgi:hypothetical protein